MSTVLIVEDNEKNMKLARDVLQARGYTVLEARHGIEALMTGAKHQGPIHLLLTDVVMPQMSGPEVAEKIQIVRPGIKVLYMSGYPDHPAFDETPFPRFDAQAATTGNSRSKVVPMSRSLVTAT